jgi:hypothetical protein
MKRLGPIGFPRFVVTGHVPLGKVKPLHVQEVVDTMRADGLAPAKARQTYVAVRCLEILVLGLARAVAREHLTDDLGALGNDDIALGGRVAVVAERRAAAPGLSLAHGVAVVGARVVGLDVALVLGEPSHDVAQEPALTGGAIDVHVEEDEGNALGVEEVEETDELAQGAGRSGTAWARRRPRTDLAAP